MFRRVDGTLLIADYKTAKFTPAADELRPTYEVQLNSYAYIAASMELPEVTGLALLYFEPETEVDHAICPENGYLEGFRMGFKCGVHEIPMGIDLIPALLMQVRELFDLKKAPAGNGKCKECVKLDGLVSLVSGQVSVA